MFSRHSAAACAVAIVMICAGSDAAAATIVQFNVVDLGSFDVELYDSTPVTTTNFLQYVTSGTYDTSISHRSVPGFIIQGGAYRLSSDPNYLLEEVPSYGAIQNEYSDTRPNVMGTIAMAKLDNQPDSATCSWFINLADNSSNLDYQNGGFTTFGNVISGWDVVEAIAGLNVWNAGAPFDNLPLMPAFDGSRYVESSDFVTFSSIAVTPEPASLALLVWGAASLLIRRRRR